MADPVQPPSAVPSALATLSFEQLLERIAARTPTPGGGSAAAFAGAIGAALGCMAVRFSMKRKESTPEQDAVLATLERGLLAVAARLSQLAEEDAASFEAVRAARKLPESNEGEKAARAAAVAAANAGAVAVPLHTARLCREAMELVDGALATLNKNLATDAASGAILLRAGARCAAWNVLVNLVGDARPEAAALRAEVERLQTRAAELETKAAEWTQKALAR